jgi:hypothetical protein
VSRISSLSLSGKAEYFINDHLGNVKMVLTEEKQQDKYHVANMETAKFEIEDGYKTIDTSRIVNVP